jgi:hypothetical protein
LPLVNSSLAPSSSCRFHWLTWIGSHRKVRCLARLSFTGIGGELLDRFAATDRLHSRLPQAEAFGSGLGLGTGGAALAQLLRRRLRLRRDPRSGAEPTPSKINDRGCPRKSDHLRWRDQARANE